MATNPPHPPAAQSIQACLDKGLLRRKPDGKLEGMSHPSRGQWGHREIALLVAALWPDGPEVGTDFRVVLQRAKEAGEAWREKNLR